MDELDVAVANPSVVAPPAAGGVVVEDGPRTTSLSASLLARLPSETRTVTFLAGTSSETDTESGPNLLAVLTAAHVGIGLTTSPGEELFGNRPLLLSLKENGTPLSAPRLVPDGDIKGGRYVSGVDDLVIGQDPSALG